MRLVAVFITFLLATVGTAANGQRPTGRAERARVQLSVCEALANNQAWLKAQDRAAWIQACEGARLSLSEITFHRKDYPGSVEASVHVTALDPLVDSDSIRIQFTVGPNSFPATASPDGTYQSRVDFDPCLEPVSIDAVAYWTSEPVGTPARTFDFSKKVSKTYQSGANALRLGPPTGPNGYVVFHEPRGTLYLSNNTAGRTYTVTQALFLCVGAEGTLQECGPGDDWSLYGSTPLPANLACGQSLQFFLQSTKPFVPLVAVFTYSSNGFVGALSTVIEFELLDGG